ncbi:hypothetical protein MKP07_03795 [Niabella hibiscisoli]|nr:hypothetical protein [Niabella hibiscisoli]MCH5715371.1 hypothetical protein [Niabella hibiscisoli]
MGIFIISGAVFFSIGALRNFQSWKWAPLRGWLLIIALIAFSMMLTWLKDVRHQHYWLGKSYQAGDMLVARLAEPLVAKERSYKAVADLTHILKSGNKSPISGNIIIYFKKTASMPHCRRATWCLLQKICRKYAMPVIRAGSIINDMRCLMALRTRYI